MFGFPNENPNRAIAPGGSRAIFALTWMLIAAFVEPASGQIPPRPGPNAFLHDLANTLKTDEAEEIRTIQQQVFAEHKVPIVVVTISQMSLYDPKADDIESLAEKWFNLWEIGSEQKNDGILVLISLIDRKGRIELGADWGRRFDDYCQRVMDRRMIPEFKKQQYGQGLIRGVKALAKMAEAGPESTPPGPGMGESFRQAGQFLKRTNPLIQGLGYWILALMLVAGVGCLVAAWLMPDYRRALIIAGVCIMGLALFFWIFVIFLGMYGKHKGYLGRSSGGSFGGGGGFGGGFSGGGGATGSW